VLLLGFRRIVVWSLVELSVLHRNAGKSPRGSRLLHGPVPSLQAARPITHARIERIELHFPRIAAPLRNKNQWTSTIGGVGAGKAATMPGFFKAAAIVMSSGAFAGFGVLMMLPPPPEDTHPSSPLFAAAQIANLFPQPCKQQLWLNTLNTDRVCQTWNLSDRDAERILSVPEPAAKAPRQPSRPAADSHVAKGETVVKARARVSHTADTTVKHARETGPRRMSTPAASPTAESTRRAGFPG
jgi:hypothetical protein